MPGCRNVVVVRPLRLPLASRNATERRATRAMKIRCLLFGMLVLVTAPLGAGSGDRLAIRVTPKVALAPALLIVQTTVESNAQNRSIEVIAESDDFYRGSEIPLDGDKAPRTTRFEFRDLPGGVYRVAAVLKGANEQRLAETGLTVTVVESDLAR